MPEVRGYGVPRQVVEKKNVKVEKSIPPKPTDLPEQTRLFLEGLNRETKPK